MVLPHTYAAALLLTILSMLCWGSWANTTKLTRNWRFELFYFDYSFGVLLAAVICAFTFGSLGFDRLLFLDDLMQTGKRNIAFGLAGGIVFNLANMLLVAAISVAGLAVAFPIGVGTALVIGVIWNYILRPQGNPVLLFTGLAIVVVAIIVDAWAYRVYALQKAQAVIATGRTRSTKKTVSPKGLVLCLVSGVLMGSFFPLVEIGKGQPGGVEMGPYAIGFVFAVGLFASTFVFNLFFMNLPVEGEPLEIREYFKGSLKYHLIGVVGGVIWATGTLANFVAASAPQEVQVGPAISYALGQGATMVSALWGLLVWKEFQGAEEKAKVLITVMLILFVIGLGMISVAPLFAPGQ
jgi:glucose uptake protein